MTANYTAPTPNKDDEQLPVVSRGFGAWKLIPYTDGRFAYYPGSFFNEGFILTKNNQLQY
jgi:hypothetical protein